MRLQGTSRTAHSTERGNGVINTAAYLMYITRLDPASVAVALVLFVAPLGSMAHALWKQDAMKFALRGTAWCVYSYANFSNEGLMPYVLNMHRFEGIALDLIALGGLAFAIAAVAVWVFRWYQRKINHAQLQAPAHEPSAAERITPVTT